MQDNEKDFRLRTFELLAWLENKPANAEIFFVNKTNGRPLVFDHFKESKDKLEILLKEKEQINS